MIDDAETKMRAEAALLFELKTSVPFYHTLQICGLVYVDMYLFSDRSLDNIRHSNPNRWTV
jgi:hypothetical protein